MDDVTPRDYPVERPAPRGPSLFRVSLIDPAQVADVQRVLSPARFRPYLSNYPNRADLALRLYAWNSALSSALWGPLGILEVTLRNALHEQLAERTSRPDWWNDQRLWDVLLPSERRGIDEAKSSLALRGRAAPTADDVVAATSMGLWTGLLSEGRARHPLHNYEGNLWRPRLQKAFPLYNGSRKHLYSQLKELKDIRNRVAHHEPIFKVRLDRHGRNHRRLRQPRRRTVRP